MFSESSHFIFVSVHLGSQGPVGGQHGEPDAHGDQDKEGRGREGEEREEELALRQEAELHAATHSKQQIPEAEGRCREERRR